MGGVNIVMADHFLGNYSVYCPIVLKKKMTTLSNT